jgi:hypothetical protein
MTSNQSGSRGSGNAHHGDGSATIGVGGPTSGEAGATPTHETQAETGGSGGAGLTRNEAGGSRQRSDQQAQGRQGAGDNTDGMGGAPSSEQDRSAGDSAMNAHMRGFQDTRSEQAGGSETGLGSPETGANQDIADIENQAGARKKP